MKSHNTLENSIQHHNKKFDSNIATRDAGNINAIARALSLSSNGVNFDTPIKMSINASAPTNTEMNLIRKSRHSFRV